MELDLEPSPGVHHGHVAEDADRVVRGGRPGLGVLQDLRIGVLQDLRIGGRTNVWQAFQEEGPM